MKLAHANCATFAGIVYELLQLEHNRVGRPVLKFLLEHHSRALRWSRDS